MASVGFEGVDGRVVHEACGLCDRLRDASGTAREATREVLGVALCQGRPGGLCGPCDRTGPPNFKGP